MRAVAIVGPGAAGTSIGLGLARAGWPLAGYVTRRGGRPAPSGAATLGTSDALDPRFDACDLVIVAVRDGDLDDVARTLARQGPWRGRVALHVSGTLTSRALLPLASQGAAVGSMHPLMALGATTPGTPEPVPAGTPFFAEGDEPAVARVREIAGALGGTFHEIAASAKPAYHAAATIAGNLVPALFAAAADVLRAAGVAGAERALEPLARRSLERMVESADPMRALTGPVARRDVESVRAHVAALREVGVRGSLRAAHAAASLLALELTAGDGDRDPAADEALATLLRRAVADALAEAGAHVDPR